MNRVLLQTTDNPAFTEVLSIDKDRVHCDRTLGNISKKNQDAMYLFDCRSGFHQSIMPNVCDRCHD